MDSYRDDRTNYHVWVVVAAVFAIVGLLLVFEGHKIGVSGGLVSVSQESNQIVQLQTPFNACGQSGDLRANFSIERLDLSDRHTEFHQQIEGSLTSATGEQLGTVHSDNAFNLAPENLPSTIIFNLKVNCNNVGQAKPLCVNERISETGEVTADACN